MRAAQHVHAAMPRLDIEWAARADSFCTLDGSCREFVAAMTRVRAVCRDVSSSMPIPRRSMTWGGTWRARSRRPVLVGQRDGESAFVGRVARA